MLYICYMCVCINNSLEAIDTLEELSLKRMQENQLLN